MSEIQKYSGMWKFFEDETPYQGELHINTDDNVIVLNTIIPANEQIPMPRPPYKGKIPYICGKLFSGTKVLLYNCFTGQETTRVGSHTQQIVYADYAFWGLEVSSEDEIRFLGAVFDFGKIIEWSGLCNYVWNHTDDGLITIEWQNKEPITLQLTDYSVSISPSGGTVKGNWHDTEITIRQHILFEFNYTSPVTWERIINDSQCMQYLIGLGLNQKVEVDKAEYLHSSIYIEYPKNDDGTDNIYHVPAEVSIGLEKTGKTHKTPKFQCSFLLDDLVNANIFPIWQEHYATLKPVLDLYFTAFSHTPGTCETLFLNLTQALETYHARFKANNASAFFSRVNDILSSFYQEGTDQSSWRNFLIDEYQAKDKKRLYLRSRLADLVFADGVLPFWPRPYSLEDYIRKVVDTRNYYTHYDPQKLEKSFTKAELPFVNSQLICLLTYHILVQIGFDPTEIRKKIVERMNSIEVSYEIQSDTHRIETHHQNAAPESET